MRLLGLFDGKHGQLRLMSCKIHEDGRDDAGLYV